MNASTIDGKEIAASINADLRQRLKALAGRSVTPGLTVVLVGDDPASRVYVSRKEKTARDLSINSTTIELSDEIQESELLETIDALNQDKSVHGILVQLPLPKQINADHVLDAIDPEKDVDGFHPSNVGALVLGRPRFIPCTPAGIMAMLQYSKIDANGKNVVVLGRSNIVGKPMANLMLQKNEWANATVTICHTGTKDLVKHTREADIVIAALGRAQAIDGAMLKPGCVVVDVGINRIPDSTRKSGYRLVGDVDFASAQTVASAITPVPGGVGPMTIAMLMSNTVLAAERQST